jgi:radical SAM superfamily enzyme YgiQ (UPF0313 family)
LETTTHQGQILVGPRPARECLELNTYLTEGSITNIQTKRGCLFDCIYCTYPQIEGHAVRVRPPEEVVAELAQIQQDFGVDTFCFVDNVFNFPLEHASAICEGIIRHGLKIQWSAFFHPRFITAEFAALLAQAGCTGVELGIDSASDPMLQALHKGFTVAEVVQAITDCKQAGLHVCCCLLIGGPGETVRTVQETFTIMNQTVPTAIVAFSGIRIYPRTAIADIAVQEGYELPDPLVPRFYIADALRDNLVQIIQAFAPGQTTFIYEGIRKELPPTFLKRMRQRGIKGPLWELKGKFQSIFGSATPGSRNL